MPGKSTRSLIAVVVASVLIAACSSSSGDLGEPSANASRSTTNPTSPRVDTDVAADSANNDTAGSDDAAVDRTTNAATPSGSSDNSSSTTLVVTLPLHTVVEVAEVGVPGLDSDDAFCAAWSRFAGSFQVVAVTAAFGSGSPAQLASLEVAAAPTVIEAYDELVANWPDELSSEADLVADEFLGPFARRLDAAYDALADTGAGSAVVTSISDAWLVGLAQRDPTTPEFVVDLPDEAWAVIDAAAAVFSGQRVPFASDPSLVTNVETPLTSEYLAVSCPDQGTLSGQEVATP